MRNRLISSNASAQPCCKGCVNVNEGLFFDHAAMVVFLSKKSIANDYESFATVRKA